MSDPRLNDIKAPDGYLLGGLRKVLKDGTVLFQRGYWGPAPADWIGRRVWVHCLASDPMTIEAAPPGYSLHEIGAVRRNLRLFRTDRPDAMPGYRRAAHKKWGGRYD